MIGTKLQSVVAELTDWYTTFCEILEFKSAAYAELDELAQNVTDFKVSTLHSLLFTEYQTNHINVLLFP